jgi:hypothetical protein
MQIFTIVNANILLLMKTFTVVDQNIHSFSSKYYIYSYKLLINSNIGICNLIFMSKPDHQMQEAYAIKPFQAVIYKFSK